MLMPKSVFNLELGPYFVKIFSFTNILKNLLDRLYFFMAQLFPSIIFLNGEALNTIEAEIYCVCRSKDFIGSFSLQKSHRDKKDLHLFKSHFCHRSNLKRNFLI